MEGSQITRSRDIRTIRGCDTGPNVNKRKNNLNE